MSGSAVGRRMPRLDAVSQVLGRAEYADDLRFPGLLHAKVLRSPHPHAAIRRVDVTRALRQPGVVAAITARDVPHNRFGFTHQDQPALCDDRVRLVGDPIAAVAAGDPRQAEEALAHIDVDYEPLPAVLDPVAAVNPAAPAVHAGGNIADHVRILSGDPAAAFRDADVVVEGIYRTQNAEHCHLEPHCATAMVGPDGRVTVWSSVQRPWVVAQDLAKILKLPLSRVRVVVTAVGGGFGGKNELSVEAVAAILAMRTRRPVRLALTREEEFSATSVRHAAVMRYRSAVRRDGAIIGREIDLILDTGAYVCWGGSTVAKAAIHAAGPFRIPNVRIDAFLVYTNRVVGGAMRGFGVPQGAFAWERHTDTIARRLGMDPAQFRLQNSLRDGDALPTGQVLPRVRVVETLDRVLAASGWAVSGEGKGR